MQPVNQMTPAEALQLVLELARQNMADECEQPDEHARQEAAIQVMQRSVKIGLTYA